MEEDPADPSGIKRRRREMVKHVTMLQENFDTHEDVHAHEDEPVGHDESLPPALHGFHARRQLLYSLYDHTRTDALPGVVAGAPAHAPAPAPAPAPAREPGVLPSLVGAYEQMDALNNREFFSQIGMIDQHRQVAMRRSDSDMQSIISRLEDESRRSGAHLQPGLPDDDE